MDYQYPLAPRTSLKIGGRALAGFNLDREVRVAAAVAQAQKLNRSLMVLGGGTNTVFTDGPHDLLIGQLRIKGLKRMDDSIVAGAGEEWDRVVKFAVNHGLRGLEALSAIPGTAGAAPVQNIGAYGAEFSDVFRLLRAYDTAQKKFVELSRDACGFSYRHSRFKDEPGRFIITQITLRLKPAGAITPIPDYPGVRDYLLERKIKNPNLQDLSRAITQIRWRKLPRPAVLPNAGSFFENPVIPAVLAAKIKQTYPAAPVLPLSDHLAKIPAGWLIEQAGFKGVRRNRLGTYDRNALVIVNHGGATSAELDDFIDEIAAAVRLKFGLSLKPEVNIVRQEN